MFISRMSPILAANTSANTINGYDATSRTQNVTFENLKVNGNGHYECRTRKYYNLTAIPITLTSLLPEILCLSRRRNSHPSAPINLALNRTASASSSQAGNPASSGNDGNTTTRWSANDGNTGHWWTVDLGASKNITGGTQVKWEQSGKAYQYKIETSNDNVNWTLKVDKTNNTSTDQIQNDVFLRYCPVCPNYRDRTAKRRLGQLLRF